MTDNIPNAPLAARDSAFLISAFAVHSTSCFPGPLPTRSWVLSTVKLICTVCDLIVLLRKVKEVVIVLRDS